MGEKEIKLSVNDKLGIVAALLKTANIAIGNLECFGPDGQGIAITLDIAHERLDECRRSLNAL